MTNAISKLHKEFETWSFKYNCYEAVHPWTPFCSYSALDVGLTVFGEAIKLYTPLYLFSQLIQRKYDYVSFNNSAQSIIRSATFMSTNTFFALLFFCSSQYFTGGKFYYYAVAYVPCFLASSLAVLVEKPSRRSSLAFYVANVASETLFRIYVAKGYVRPIQHGQVYIFTLAIATIMWLAKKHGFEDDPLSSAIRVIVGPEEAGRRRRMRLRQQEVDADKQSSSYSLDGAQQQEALLREQGQTELVGTTEQSSTTTISSSELFGQRFRNLITNLKLLLTTRHQLCPHKDCSCAYYVTRSTGRALLIGYAVQLSLKLSTKIQLLLKDPKQLFVLATDSNILGFGMFISLFTSLYKATNCCLRWSSNENKPSNCFVAGLVAGPSLFLYPSPTVALYVLWKCLESLFNEAVRTELIKNKDAFIVVLYSLGTSQLFYSALMNPKYLKKSYMAFLDRVSHHRLHSVNRSVLDVFGTQASAGYEDFFPDLHPRFMSRAFLGSIWIWLIEQKISVKQLSSV